MRFSFRISAEVKAVYPKVLAALISFVITGGPALASSSCSWQVINPPNLSDYQLLTALDVVSASDVWAAGIYGVNGVGRAYFEHYNGSQWTTIKAPNLTDITVAGIAHFASNDVWAVGYDEESGLLQPVTLHSNGTKWKVFPNAASGVNGQLFSVVRVGRFLYASGYLTPIKPYIERFD